MKTPLSIYALSGLVGAIGVAPLAAGQSQAPVVSPSSSPAKVSLVDAPRLPGALDAAPATWSGSPLDMECGSLELTQSTDPALIEAGSVWCGTVDFNSETRFARAFTAPHDLSLECVTFAVRQNAGADWPCQVRVLLGGTAASYSSLTLLTETTVNIPAGTDREMFTAEMPALSIPSGTDFIIELVTPTRDPAAGGDGGLLALGFNSAGESAPTYIYAEACGLSEYQTLASVGFGNRHLALSLGVDQGLVSPTLGGFPISIIGSGVLSELEGEVFAIGDGGADPVGLSIAYGDLTMGASAGFRILSSGDEVGATVAIAFQGATATDRLVFRDGPSGNDTAVLDLEFDDPSFDLFDLHVYDDGELVGTLKNQASGEVTFSDPTGSTSALSWMFRGGEEADTKVEGHCKRTYFPPSQGGGLASSDYGGKVEHSTAIWSSGPGPVLTGDGFSITPADGLPGAGQPPISIDVVTTRLPGLAVNVSDASPTVNIGDALSQPRPFGAGIAVQAGVSFSAIGVGEEGLPSSIFATDLTGDGVADLRLIPSATPGVPGSAEMRLGGAVSASIGMSVVSPAPSGASLILESGGLSQSLLYPWGEPGFPDFIAVSADFSSGTGTGLYTIQAFDDAGILVYEESGMRGIAGGSSAWPNKCGKLGGPTPCYVSCYPDFTTFRTAAGSSFEVREIRILAEDAGPAPLLDSFRFTAVNMGELQLFDPEVELPDFGTTCYADCDDSGSLDFFDFLCFQNAFAAGDPYADCDDSGSLDFFDFLCFQNEFAAGCP